MGAFKEILGSNVLLLTSLEVGCMGLEAGRGALAGHLLDWDSLSSCNTHRPFSLYDDNKCEVSVQETACTLGLLSDNQHWKH